MFRRIAFLSALSTAAVLFMGCGLDEVFGPNREVFSLVISCEVPHNHLVYVNGGEVGNLKPTDISIRVDIELETREQRSPSIYGPFYADVVVQLLDLDAGKASRVIEDVAISDRFTSFAFTRYHFR